jgi:hypothetical protein
MAGFVVNTVRSGDKASKKDFEIAAFNDRMTKSQIFVANVNIMATGVNLHRCCSADILLNFHTSMKMVAQLFKRLHRVGIEKPVYWEVVKVKNS